MPARLWQHLSLRQGNQLVAHGEALAGPGLEVPFTFKGFKGLLEAACSSRMKAGCSRRRK